MKLSLDDFDVDTGWDEEIGIFSVKYDDAEIVPFEFCPFCGASIEYEQNKTKKYVNKPVSKWILEDAE